MKKKIVIATIITSILASVSGCGTSKTTDMYNDILSQAQEELEQLPDLEEIANLESSSTEDTSADVPEGNAPEQVSSEVDETDSPEQPSSLPASTEEHIYDNAEIKDVMNGTRAEKIGEYSVISIDSSECTLDALADWYFNYVKTNEYNWCMILYTDKNDNSGVYSIPGMVEKDVIFNIDEYGDYSLGSSDNSTLYCGSDDGSTLIEINSSEQ